MSKFTDFYKKAVANDEAKKELTAILGDREFKEATDEQLEKLSGLAKKLGFDITVEEARAYLNNANTELDDDELDAVAGGKQLPPEQRNPSGGGDRVYQNPSEGDGRLYYKR